MDNVEENNNLNLPSPPRMDNLKKMVIKPKSTPIFANKNKGQIFIKPDLLANFKREKATVKASAEKLKEKEEAKIEVEKIEEVEDINEEVEEVEEVEEEVEEIEEEVEEVEEVEEKEEKIEKKKEALVSKKKETLPPVVTKPKIVEKKIKEVKDVKEAVVKKKKYKTPEYHLMGLEEQGKHRARFKAQFFLLKDTWGNAIPEINDQMSLVEIHELYEMYIKNIHIKSTTGKYKVYMVIMWLGIEFICIKIGLNVSGYTMSQFKSMNKYERLLLELGEKNYSSSLLNDNNDWPVEVNIIFMALVNAVVFIIIKVLAEYIGEGFANTITEMMSTYLSGADPNPGNILFGGQPSNDLKSPPGNHSQASEHANMLANFGSMFLNTQQKKQATQSFGETTQAKSPKFKPVYDD